MKARYRGTLLGFLWSLVNPLLLLAIYSFVFTVIFQPRIQGVTPYGIFLFTGLLPWIWFSSALLESAVVFQEQAPLLKKVYFPLEVLPLTKVFSQGVHFFLALPILVLSLALTGHLGWRAFFSIIPLVGEFLFLVGASLVVGGLAAYFKDLRDILQNLLTLSFFATPIIYTLDMLHFPWLKQLIFLNPLTPLWLSFQEALFFNKLPHLPYLAGSLAIGGVTFILGLLIFQRLKLFIVETA